MTMPEPLPSSSEEGAEEDTDELSAEELAERTDEVTAVTTSIFRQALNGMLLLVAGLTVLGVVIGLIIDGSAGVWGALLGAGLTIVFSGTTVLTMLKTAGSTPQMMAGVVLGGWVAKMVVLVAALAVLGQFDFYNKYIFAAVLLVGVMASVGLDYRAVSKGRMPYVVPRQDR